MLSRLDQYNQNKSHHHDQTAMMWFSDLTEWSGRLLSWLGTVNDMRCSDCVLDWSLSLDLAQWSGSLGQRNQSDHPSRPSNPRPFSQNTEADPSASSLDHSASTVISILGVVLSRWVVGPSIKGTTARFNLERESGKAMEVNRFE
jgi:hypothetical protein